MPITIKTTGLEQYASGGEGRLQLLIIGGPGAGKTRMSSYWPKPFYANCEAGLSSIADRTMPYADINSSQDMLDVLAHMKLECRQPYQNRQFQTLVVDTIDAFQRLVKDEWLRMNPGAQSFRGFDAWGYLDAKMQMLLTRLLNLDMNVVVLAHYTDKTIKEGVGENASERQEFMLQLSGEVKDNIFNDFDLVGWIGTYWDVEDGQRVEKRGLTFKRTPEKPFLKDRLNVTPPWMEVTFSSEDYDNLFIAVIGRLDELKPSEQIGEIASAVPEQMKPSAGVVGPGSGGVLPPQDPSSIPLTQFDKPTLQRMAKELGIEFKTNTIKSELIEAIEAKRAEPATEPVPVPVDDVGPATVFGDPPASDASAPSAPTSPPPVVGSGAAAAPTDAPTTPVQSASVQESAGADTTGAHGEPDPGPPAVLEDIASGAAATLDEPTADPDVVNTEAGPVNADGVILTPEQVAAALGGDVLSAPAAVETPVVGAQPAAEMTPAPAAQNARPTTCEWPTGCDVVLATQNRDYVTLSGIKYRKYTCAEHFLEAKRLNLKPGLVGL